MPQPSPFLALTSRMIRAGDIPENGLFIWQNAMYVVLPIPDGADEQEYDGKILVKQVAGGWTRNPYERWQYHVHQAEKFQLDCPVAELIFNPEWAA